MSEEKRVVETEAEAVDQQQKPNSAERSEAESASVGAQRHDAGETRDQAERQARGVKKKTKEQLYMDEAAKAGAREVLNLQRQQRSVNLYRSMERLLRAYPKLKYLNDNPELYGFHPVGKSKSISIAPAPGSVIRDPIEALEEHIDSRAASYDRSAGRFKEVDNVVQLFINQPEFIVIRMLYWNEDAYGKPRPEGDKRWSFEEIQEELAAAGIVKNIKTIRMWRTKLVQDMTVMMFGVDGAVSVEAREPKQGQKDGEVNAQT